MKKHYRYVIGKEVTIKGHKEVVYVKSVFALNCEWWKKFTRDPFEAWHTREKALAEKAFRIFSKFAGRRAWVMSHVYRIECASPTIIEY